MKSPMSFGRRCFLIMGVAVVIVLGILAATGIPSFVKPRNTSSRNACINGLRIIDSGKEPATVQVNVVASTNDNQIKPR
jgi:hypothetical protein